jgi:glycosyltransferase involved in cell wall biosynthesis
MNCDRPQISVVMMYHNEETNIRRAVTSILEQTHRDFEAILVDDGSTDRGPVRVEELLRRRTANRLDPRIQHVRLETNRGADFARDLAIGKSRGPYLALLAGDDYWDDRHYLRDAARALEKHPQAAGFFARTRLVAGPKRREVGLVGWAPRTGWNPPEVCREAFFQDKLNIPGSSFVFRRDLLEKLGGFSAALGGQSDTFANHAMAMQHGVIYSKDKVTVMAMAADTIGANQTSEDWARRMGLLENRLREIGLLEGLGQGVLDAWRQRRVAEFVSSIPIKQACEPVRSALTQALGYGGHSKPIRDFLVSLSSQMDEKLGQLESSELKVLQRWVQDLKI